MALVLLVALAPLLVFAAALILFLSGRTPLVAHRRVGQFGVPFWMLKFRTMWPRKRPARSQIGLVSFLRSDDAVPVIKTTADPRVTSRFARFCRRYSIDELPQLLHVWRGEMSLVGPRPLTQPELTAHYGIAARAVLRVRPGMSGLWQIRGRNRLTYRQRKRLDLFFVRNVSVALYLTTLTRTVPRVLAGRDAW